MAWFDRFFWFSSEEHEYRLAREVAVQGRRQVVERIVPRVHTLSRAQARGYIRAKSTPILMPMVERAIHRDDRLTIEALNRVASLARDEMVHLVLDELARAALRDRYRRAAA